MKEVYGIEPAYVFDNHVCKYNKNVLPLFEVDNLNLENVVFLFTIAKNSKKELLNCLIEKNLKYIELDFPMNDVSGNKFRNVGKYSYGDIIKYSLDFCESIGVFCSFAEGIRVVWNHAHQYISTHPFIYHDVSINECL